MSVSKVNFNDSNEAYIIIDSIGDIDKEKFKSYLDMDHPSFLKCEFENDESFILYYAYGNRITLKQFLSRVQGKAEIIAFLKSLTKAYMTAEFYGLNTDHILLGINSIFYNEESQQVSCIYLPVNEGVLPVRTLRAFLKEMLVNITYSEDDSMTWLGNLIRYISRNKQLSYCELYEFLESDEMADIASNDIASNIEVMPENKTEEEGTAAIEAAKSNEEDSVLGDLQSILESIPAAESVNTLKSMSDVFGEIDREASTDTDEVKETEAFEEESVEVPEEEPVKEELEEELVEEETPEEMPEEIPEKEPAVEVPVKAAYLPATLTRCVNHVAYVLEKPEIRIGKSPDNDICISDNPAISRVHAIIEGFQGEYRIKDNGSTNHSFVNGIVLGENQEKLLNNGDRILLANEEFIFKL